MSDKTKALAEKLVHMARTRPVCVQEGASIGEVWALMRKKQVHCVMVCRGPKLAGIFTERDFLMRVFGEAKPTDPVSKYMTTDPVIARPDETVGQAVEAMNAKGLRNLPLVDERGAPASLLTVNTIIRYLADHFPAEVVNRPPTPHLISEEADGA